MVRNLSAVDAIPGETKASVKWPKNPHEIPLNDMDTGALVNELAKLNLLPGKIELTPHEEKTCTESPESLVWTLSEKIEPNPIQEGTYRGTKLALTKVYDLVEQSYMSTMDVGGWEPLLPSDISKEEKQRFFVFTKTKGKDADGYPPHLNLGLNAKYARKHENEHMQRSDLWNITLFNKKRLAQLMEIMYKIPPLYFDWGTPDQGETIADIEKYQREKRAEKFDIFDRPNVGDLPDWYSDARFAQQQFTGTNPTTIERASNDWIHHFTLASKKSDDDLAQRTINDLSISDRESFYVQDYSYFRKAAGLDSDAEIKCAAPKGWRWWGKQEYRYGCAAVCLFYLNGKGQLYPLAIVTDWRGSLERSVTIYNRELFKRTDIRTGKEKPQSENEQRTDEAHDWPWRYAKTCVQCSDWFRHEVTVHLTRTHLIEEAIIVSANRQLEPDHPVFRILRPHWRKTLALNGSARSTLVPSVILKIIGFKRDQALNFIREEYRSFDFQNSYVPKDLSRRGFPPEELDTPKFHNYAYARCINSMWNKIRDYVHDILSLSYPGDVNDVNEKVKDDSSIQEWCKEMRSPDGADLREFPRIETFEELVDCVTMCIHIASPQHSAVNYLQDYYQDFVINKPSCLFAEPPDSLDKLLAYTEKDLVKALPIKHTHEWLLSSHVPYLLSFKPNPEDETLIACAHTAWSIYNQREKSTEKEKRKTAALLKFYQALQATTEEFERYAKDKDDFDDIPYDVLESNTNAVSILI